VHYRSDYPARDDVGWSKHLLATAGTSGPVVRDAAAAPNA
jgi:succinate dehydrogenase/fumarate reductase flavoprotein subunit